MRKNTGFTLVEVLVAVALTGIILLTGYSAFQKIMEAQGRLSAAIDVQKNLFYTNEKLAALIREGGTLDYEEYFNRRMLGYEQEERADNIFTFKNYSHFGNGNVNSKPPIYFCGVSGGTDGEGCMNTAANVLFNSLLYPPAPPNTTVTTTNHFTQIPPEHQPYGQYAALAYNYNDLVGYPVPIMLPPIFKDHPTEADVLTFDRDQGKVIPQNTRNVGLPELYLIKKNLDNTYTRTYFRHVYIDDSFIDDSITSCDPTKVPLSSPLSNINGCLGKIQMVKLTSCDNFTAAGTLGSDGIIEGWIPHLDFSVGTVTCPDQLPEVANIYKSAHEDVVDSELANLVWVDVTSPDMNIIRATFLPHPLKIPALMSGAGDKAESPKVSLYLESTLSARLKAKSFVLDDKNYPRTLITTYDLSE